MDGQIGAMAAAALMIAAVAMFPIFFKEANAGFLAEGRSDDEMVRAVRRWATWHWVRTGISLGAFAVAVAAPWMPLVSFGAEAARAVRGAAGYVISTPGGCRWLVSTPVSSLAFVASDAAHDGRRAG